ncbi:MAG: endo alpha-1,4 polygalactosaminidase [Actinomycetota bacterium]|nr:endo alpha-1,4 polygalactosaminidase [Actinomycetota bacterium]
MTALFLALVALIFTALPAPPVESLPTDATADYQLGGTYEPASGVGVLTRDRTERPAAGLYNICYVNAFQTQPGKLRWWEAHHPGLLLRSAEGDLVRDPDWPDEVLLDIRTEAKRRQLSRIEDAWFKGCAASGYQAVEPDNLDSWTRSDGLLTRDMAVAFARSLISGAHGFGLAIGQKNSAELAGRRLGFDFAVAEECEVYRECETYLRNFDRNVIEIEYTDNGRAAFRRACSSRGQRIAVLLRDRDLVAANHHDYVYEAC